MPCQRDLGRIQRGSRFCGCCGKDCREPAAAPRDCTAGRNHRSKDTLFPAQSPGSTKESLRSCLAGKAEAGCLEPGQRAGAGGLQRAAQIRKTHSSASPGSRAVYTLSSHFVCCRCFRCCTCIPGLQGSAEVEGKGGWKNNVMNVALDSTTASYW